MRGVFLFVHVLHSMYVVYAHHPDSGWMIAMDEDEIELKRFGNEMPVYANVITGYRVPVQSMGSQCRERVYTIYSTQMLLIRK
jgi:hypothetical protein